MSENCETCRYAAAITIGDDDCYGIYLCHRVPPLIFCSDPNKPEQRNDPYMYAHPQVMGNDWCGEYKPKECVG